MAVLLYRYKITYTRFPDCLYFILMISCKFIFSERILQGLQINFEIDLAGYDMTALNVVIHNDSRNSWA